MGKQLTYSELEKKVKSLKKEIKAEHDKLQGVLNLIHQGLYTVNRDRVIEHQNKILENTFGDQTGSKCYKTYFGLETPCEFCPVIEIIENGETRHIEAELEDGTSYNLSASPFTDVDGEVKGIVLLKGVTEKKILKSKATQGGNLESHGELFAQLAHEINNPIHGVINYAQILKDECEEEGKDADIPKRIIHEGERIAKMVKKLGAFARDKFEPDD